MSSNTSSAAQKAPPAAAAAEDDVDDLDDLDDVLDEFNQPSGSASTQKPSSSLGTASDATATAATSTTTAAKDTSSTTAGTAATAPGGVAGAEDDAGLDDMLSEDFAKELAQGMQALMKELGGEANTNAEGLLSGAGANAGAGAAGGQEFNEQELMKQFEAMMAGFGGAGAAAGAASSDAGPSARSAPAASASTAPTKPGNFNDAIAATMAKLKESDASATADSASSDNPFAGLSGAEGEEMAKLLAALGGSGDLSGLEGAMDNPELTKMLEGMMDELMSRDILYEPLKELRDKYPPYLAGSESAGISAEDRKRYEEQSRYITEIVKIFDEPGYDAKDKVKAAKVQELMNQMQDCGSPPKEIVGDMPAELENMPGFGGAGGAAPTQQAAQPCRVVQLPSRFELESKLESTLSPSTASTVTTTNVNDNNGIVTTFPPNGTNDVHTARYNDGLSSLPLTLHPVPTRLDVRLHSPSRIQLLGSDSVLRSRANKPIHGIAALDIHASHHSAWLEHSISGQDHHSEVSFSS
ncbi:hypothetical protein PHSY_002232 [Pseudozyma hubeiensis SY62]|uniref:Uncharacterized protein n=1 Tax=Pseudozyma hubeiensis (strain SY62) TaxID=1305764 RepID=R9P0M0_PSEHS|nr:hypothetical protein PHSY_002232 [Pseudozyma hubeiensis SY62]GAC94659.1 hypothetical protein PHSY_002232 [Pseudozyma hubeiensis SY62]